MKANVPRIHGVRSPPVQQGFTLLEILAVITIIAITISFAALSLGARAQDERLANEALRLRELMQLAAEEAVAQGEEQGLLLAADGYRFYHLENNSWTQHEEGPLRERQLPEGIRLNLFLEGRDTFDIVGSAKKDNDKEEKTSRPQVLFLSSGEITPFVLEMRAGHLPVIYRTEGKITGSIDMKRVDG